MKKYSALLVFFIVTNVFAQQNDIAYLFTDSLQDVTINAFNYKKKWREVPVSIGIIGAKQMQYIGTSTLLSSVNSIPGVRMEERSPGSYRLSIRGSLLRSPFGVRNIKVYWNGLPLTDGGGNTYFNLVDATQLSSLELIKGPAASLYGANTGGVVLLQSDNAFLSNKKNTYQAAIAGGSYGLFQQLGSWQYQSATFSSKIMQSHQQSDGYREQSANRKDNITWQGAFKLQKQQFDILAFYTAQHYQTPGGITLAQMQQNPTLARLATNTLPGALQQQTGIYNNTFFIGLHHIYTINNVFSTEAGVVFHHTDFKNPFITNYEKRDENNVGFNGKLIFQKQLNNLNIQWLTGGEILANKSAIINYGNKAGMADTVQFKDDVYINQWFAFTQIQLSGKKFNISAGLSANNQNYRYIRLSAANANFTKKTTNIVVMPRLSALYQITQQASFYTSISKGFSPPSLAEIRPSNNIFNTTLQPEYGWNFELGLKGGLWHNRLLFDINYYNFRLQNAIVTRNNANGTQFFVNAGNTKQNGAEVWLQYHLLKQATSTIKSINFTESYSYQPYRFLNYQQGINSFAGNKLTGVPTHILVSGLAVETVKGYFVNMSHNYTSSLPLTDANDVFADAYHLLQAKLGINFKINKANVQLYVGGDNLLNQTYSLGNDINAVGKRYYNPATAINFYGGCKVSF
ncbi:MAG: TonB-dependent receptor [Deinococcales bacterium]|nr:TonB-dependent receptor [Chitinophagaceae bacterium]